MRSNPPLLFGHRGDPGRARENTLASFDHAIRAGADGIEFDVRASADGLVIHHDAYVRRAGRRHLLSRMPRSQRPAWMPTLDGLVAWARGNEALLDVEIKESGLEAAVLDAFGSVRDRCVFTSFHPDVIYALRALDAGARVGWISKAEPEAVLAIAGELGPDLVVVPARRCTPSFVAALSDLDLQVWAWNVNAGRTADRLVAMGVEGLITDEPKRLAVWRDGRARPQRVPRTGRRGS
jgi:glycerophosphoryl diester phosphodiesterase